jgi:hypothetical protein
VGLLRGRESVDYFVEADVGEALSLAVEIACALRGAPGPGVAIGVHTGRVVIVANSLGQWVPAGAGIERAREIAALGDNGSLLVSWDSVRMLGRQDAWHERLEDLGDRQDAEGVVFRLFSLRNPLLEVGVPAAAPELRPWRPARSTGPSPWQGVLRAVWTALMLAVIAAFVTRLAAPGQFDTVWRWVLGLWEQPSR